MPPHSRSEHPRWKLSVRSPQHVQRKLRPAYRAVLPFFDSRGVIYLCVVVLLQTDIRLCTSHISRNILRVKADSLCKGRYSLRIIQLCQVFLAKFDFSTALAALELQAVKSRSTRTIPQRDSFQNLFFIFALPPNSQIHYRSKCFVSALPFLHLH